MIARLGLVLWLGCSPWAHGQEALQALWEPSGRTQAPAWFQVKPAEPGMLGRAAFGVLPAAEGRDCLVTVCFQESEGGFLRILWEGQNGGAVTLSENFYEGIGLANKRSLLLSRALVGEGGTLVFQSGDRDLGLDKLKLEWLRSVPVQVVEGEGDGLRVLEEGGKGLGADELHGDMPFPEEDLWRGEIVTAPLLEKPERIEEGTAFACTLEKVPEQALLEVEVAGLPVDRALRVWANGSDAGLLVPEVPVLEDPGYRQDAGGNWMYAGWRKARLLLNTEGLRADNNEFQFGPAGKDGALPPIAVKNLKLQLRYPLLRALVPEIRPSQP
jgi:hypothetical protein